MGDTRVDLRWTPGGKKRSGGSERSSQVAAHVTRGRGGQGGRGGFSVPDAPLASFRMRDFPKRGEGTRSARGETRAEVRGSVPSALVVTERPAVPLPGEWQALGRVYHEPSSELMSPRRELRHIPPLALPPRRQMRGKLPGPFTGTLRARGSSSPGALALGSDQLETSTLAGSCLSKMS